MKMLRPLLGFLVLVALVFGFTVPTVASGAVIIKEDGKGGLIVIYNALLPQRVPTEAVLWATQPATDPTPWGHCTDPLGSAWVDIGEPVLQNGYLIYEDPMEIVVPVVNVSRNFTCSIYKNNTKLLEFPVSVQ